MTRTTETVSPFQLQLFPSPEAAPSRAPSLAAPSPAAPVPVLPAVSSPDPGRQTLSRRLGKLMPGRLKTVTLTDNRSTIVSAREVGRRFEVRIQRCFVSAPDETLVAVAAFLSSGKGSRGRRQALSVIRAYFEHHRPRSTSGRRRRRVVMRPVGCCIDLRQIRDELNRRYFGDELEVHITWGRALPSRRRVPPRAGKQKRFSVRLGTYGDQDNVVRIHRYLDRRSVPRYVVESVVYHEMLHAAVPPEVKSGRRRIHTPEFRRRERIFADHQRAERWLDRNLNRLL